MKTINSKQNPALTLSPLALAIFLLLPAHANAFTSSVNSGAVVDGETVVGGTQNIGTNGTANNTLIEVTGTQTVFQNGVSNDATVNGVQDVQSGIANRSIVNAGGSQMVGIASVANDTILNGGAQTVQNPTGRANRTVINQNGVQTVTLMGTAADTVINNGGLQVVTNKGVANDTQVNSGAEQSLQRGMLGGVVATNTRIDGGLQSVYDTATANNSTVSNGGRINLYQGAQANGLVAEAGGTVNIMEDGVKTVDSLTLNGGSLAFVPSADGSFKTFTVNALSGSGSILMNTDIASQHDDLLVVQGAGMASGDHTLIVGDSGREPTSMDGRLVLVDTNGGSAKFGLHGGHVDAGAFRYTLQQQGDDWVLASGGSLPVDPVTPVDPEKPVDPVTPVDPANPLDPVTPPTPVNPRPENLSKGTNAAIAAHTAGASLWSAQMNALVKRLGELRMGQDDGGLWTRAIGKRFDVSEHSSRAYTQDVSGLEIGADKAFAVESGKVYVGAMVGTARSDLDFGEGASGEIDSRMFGIYATYLNDNGVYVDSVLKYSRFDNDIKTPSNLGESVKGSYSTNGVGANIEIGKRIALKDGWFVEPQVELTATQTQGASYTASNGLRVKTDNLDSLQSRVGSLFGRSLELSNGMKAQPYVKASYITEHAGSGKVTVNGNKFDAELPGSRVEVGFGGVLQVTEKSKISLDAEYAKGNGIEQPFGVSLGYRYLW
ncbi:autotransporter outer membrane beta-barrel domain-containing protein [Pseudomonas sp. N40(2020)]|uniref:autotransporter outer membrane beta-barrel domain-containing protein n=1 Tax=Pseudomonas sp. N40(2020) TaxID=2767798 RepID=UPI001656FA09|nr:autotransporter outer membrane beta-barrel domain-containing protein [Pseudomonas sp. N40(2020)]MBC8995240.1 autotransporter outer membrane beta-barrel domain-containing protein [Pseudomonas sp. N40(2020)]